MTLPTGVIRRGGMHWLRVGIPDDLRHLVSQDLQWRPGD